MLNLKYVVQHNTIHKKTGTNMVPVKLSKKTTLIKLTIY